MTKLVDIKHIKLELYSSNKTNPEFLKEFNFSHLFSYSCTFKSTEILYWERIFFFARFLANL